MSTDVVDGMMWCLVLAGMVCVVRHSARWYSRVQGCVWRLGERQSRAPWDGWRCTHRRPYLNSHTARGLSKCGKRLKERMAGNM